METFTFPDGTVYLNHGHGNVWPEAGYPGYDVDDVDESNARDLREMGADDLPHLDTDYRGRPDGDYPVDDDGDPAPFLTGRYGLVWVPEDGGGDIGDAIRGLDSYPVINEETHSEVCTEREDQAWADYAAEEFRAAILAYVEDDDADTIADVEGASADDLFTLWGCASEVASISPEHSQEGVYFDTDRAARVAVWLLWGLPLDGRPPVRPAWRQTGESAVLADWVSEHFGEDPDGYATAWEAHCLACSPRWETIAEFAETFDGRQWSHHPRWTFHAALSEGKYSAT